MKVAFDQFLQSKVAYLIMIWNMLGTDKTFEHAVYDKHGECNDHKAINEQ